MSAIELKLCPFCGGKSEQESYIVEAVVHCSCCFAVIRRTHARDGDTGIAASAAAWNTRAPHWQPIETAPRDGTRLLLFGDGDTVVAYFNVSYGTWDDGDHHDDIPGLTHWQPLPAAP